MVEHTHGKGGVKSSNLFSSSSIKFARVAERSIAPDCKSGAGRLRGFESLPLHSAEIAQLVEQRFCKPSVKSSSLFLGFLRINILKLNTMAKKGNRILIRLRNKETGSFYTTSKNRINSKDKLKMKKFDSKLKKHLIFEEDKVK